MSTASIKIKWCHPQQSVQMSARDRFHDAVKIALQKDGWTITADPLFFRFGSIDVYIDLAAERIIAAERDGKALKIPSVAFILQSLVHGGADLPTIE